jgi:RimJ/RimL family protein N-acetyltransferase
MIQQIPTLENNRVRLQPLEIKDVEALADIALSQPALFQLMSQDLGDKGAVYSYVRKALDDFNAGHSLPFLIIDKPTGKVAGTTRFLNFVKEHKRVEVGGTWIAQEFHNSGLNKAMKFLMLQYAFEQLQLNRVEIKTSELNHVSRRAIESIGGVFEGILRHHMVNDSGTLRNTAYYSILKDEWQHIQEAVFGKYKTAW